MDSVIRSHKYYAYFFILLREIKRINIDLSGVTSRRGPIVPDFGSQRGFRNLLISNPMKFSTNGQLYTGDILPFTRNNRHSQWLHCRQRSVFEIHTVQFLLKSRTQLMFWLKYRKKRLVLLTLCCTIYCIKKKYDCFWQLTQCVVTTLKNMTK